jgi:hypothetical protein
MEQKLQRAEEKRQQQLNRIVRKAHDEDSKVNEILFINSLEAQNKKYDILSKEKDREMKKQDESRCRHEENMCQIRQKALELSVHRSSSVGCDDVPICEPYDTYKLCHLCQVLIKSEVFLFGHLRGMSLTFGTLSLKTIIICFN